MKPISMYALVMLLLLFAVTPALASDMKSYMSLKAGTFEPKGDLDGADSATSIGFSYGSYLTENSALEFSINRHKLSVTSSGTDFFLGNWTETDEMTIIPLRVTYKGGAFSEKGGFYAGIGMGLYMANADFSINSSTMGYGNVSDSDVVMGLHLSIGGYVNLSESVFLGIDMTMDKTQDASISGTVYGLPITIEGNLEGQTYSLALGKRF